MPRRNLIFYPDRFYHIYNIGFEKQNIFLEANDYEKFYSKLLQKQKEFEESGISLEAWNLLPDHFHILIIQRNTNQEDNITKFMQQLQCGYGKWFANKYKKKGQIFDGRFEAVEVGSEEQLQNITNYIEQNTEKHLGIPYQNRKRKSNNQTEANITVDEENIKDIIIEN
ncbi:transposase [Candidatus Absconditicoccus praedator]|uniref:transposase n=1 Tax=Candidatus Absconditicoccus praedator TaxID=2735562 RepID=UPI001E4D33FE|nr:transposase [Candidatus Absconditicoccus praedator]UFX82876.1 transposase [Candidatus Absconditicoccus praedator]